MSKIYENHDSNYYVVDSMSSIDEYLKRIDKSQQTPSVINDYSDAPHVHKFHHNNSAYPVKHDDHQMKMLHGNHHHHAPETHKKVHFSEHQKNVEIDRNGKHEVFEEKTIDVEADGFIQKSHKNFESCNTFKAY